MVYLIAFVASVEKMGHEKRAQAAGERAAQLAGTHPAPPAAGDDAIQPAIETGVRP